MLRTNLPDNDRYARALRMRSVIKFKSEFGGLIPYLKRQVAELEGKTSPRVVLPRAPPVSKTPLRRIPAEHLGNKPYSFVPKHMDHYGTLDGYALSPSVPKFDPWVRDLLREKNSSTEDRLTSTSLRDPSTPDRIMQHFLRYDRTWKRLPNTARMRRAQRIVADFFSPMRGSCEPIDFNFEGWSKIVQQLELASSPGLPLRREFATQSECLPYIYDKSKRLNHFAKFLPPHSVRAPPCQIGLRPGLTTYEDLNEKVKARNVWAYPAEVKVVEMRYTLPIMTKLVECFGQTPYVVGVNMTKALPMVIDHLLEPGHNTFVSDISHLDDSIGPDYIRWAFKLIRSWFNMGFTKSSVTRNDNVLSFIEYYFTNTLVLLPSGQLVRKRGGVPSGSGFTQIIDTLVSVLISVYALLEQGESVAMIKRLLFCVGDDVAMTVSKVFEPDKFAKSLGRLGFSINISKAYLTSEGSDLIFLGYSKYGGHVKRGFEDLLKQALFPERFVGSEGRSCSRVLGQLVACGMCDPRFNSLVHRAFEKRLFAPLALEEHYEPQARWFRKVLDVDEMPKNLNSFELYPLV